MDRTVFTSQKFVGDVVSRLVKYYDRITVERDKEDRLLFRIVATCPRSAGGGDDFGGSNPVVAACFPNPPHDSGRPHHIQPS